VHILTKVNKIKLIGCIETSVLKKMINKDHIKENLLKKEAIAQKKDGDNQTQNPIK
jgi:hypothetical protein